MAGQLLLINPRRRRRHAKHATNPRKRRHVARKMNPRRRRRRNVIVPTTPFYAMNPRRRRRARRHNPMHHARRHVFRRRHRNPLSLNSMMALFRDSAIQAAGGLAFDYAYSYVNNMLPASMKRTPGAIGVGDAVKVAVVAAAGLALDRPTRGFAYRAALGSLQNEFRQMIVGVLPATISQNLAFYTPSPVIRGQVRTGPNRGRLVTGSPLLSGRSGVAALVPGSPSLSAVPVVTSAFNMPTLATVAAGVPIR